jgi:hypothetical protein
MNQDYKHPITPPPELVVQWIKEFSQPNDPRWQEYEQDIATRAAQWGADQELEECLSCAGDQGLSTSQMRNHRRPKPPSLKEQALEILAGVAVYELHGGATTDNRLSAEDMSIIRRALEQLPDNH